MNYSAVGADRPRERETKEGDTERELHAVTKKEADGYCEPRQEQAPFVPWVQTGEVHGDILPRNRRGAAQRLPYAATRVSAELAGVFSDRGA